MGFGAKPLAGLHEMAIYSLHHKAIGKSTQAQPYTAAAHLRYITRTSAASRVEAGRMPDKVSKAIRFMVDAENQDRKNGRVVDKLMLALPRELDSEQRVALVRTFAEQVTRGRAAWIAAFHDMGKDALNPHAHLVIRDRDTSTGKRVAELSEKGSTQRLRELWQEHVNRALEAAGRDERVDCRTLMAQGIRRDPTVHEGPKSRQMERRGVRPQSRVRRFRNRAGSKSRFRDVDYRKIDAGVTRPDHNRRIGAVETESDYWHALDEAAESVELAVQQDIHVPPPMGRGRLTFLQEMQRRGRIRAKSERGRQSSFDQSEELEPD